MTDSNPFKIGDRVRIKASEADGFFQPFRKFGQEGRPAIVEKLGASPWTQYMCRVRFLTKRGHPSVHREAIDCRFLELIGDAE